MTYGNVRMILAVLLVVMLVTACARKREIEVPVPPNIGLRLIEERHYSSGPGPDYVRVYLLTAGRSVSKSDVPIFQGQEVGQICYQWGSPTALQFGIDGGYVDSVARNWKSPTGLDVNVTFLGKVACK